MGSSIRIEPAAAGFVAVVHGVDLAKMDDETLAGALREPRTHAWIRRGTAEESLPLLQFLYAHASSDALTCRFECTPGSVAIWATGPAGTWR